MRYFSMFSGIGGFEIGIQGAFESYRKTQQANADSRHSSNDTGDSLQEWGQSATCVGYSEIDKYAIKVYERHFNGHRNYGDATRIDPTDLPDFDLLVGGFPCQAFSIAGKRKGFDDTRGTLFFDIARILAEKRPRHLALENVKGLLSHDSGKTFQTILGVLSDLGYRVEWQVLNSKDFGVPQNRERIYFVGHLRGECSGQVLSIGSSNGATIKQLNQPKHSNERIYSEDGISPTLNTMQGGLRQPFVSGGLQKNAGLMHDRSTALTQAMGHGGGHTPILNAIRRLTPKECERLQGFPDDWTKYGADKEVIARKYTTDYPEVFIEENNNLASVGFPTDDLEEISDTQRYKMCGNAVTVNVVEAVMKGLLSVL